MKLHCRNISWTSSYIIQYSSILREKLLSLLHSENSLWIFLSALSHALVMLTVWDRVLYILKSLLYIEFKSSQDLRCDISTISFLTTISLLLISFEMQQKCSACPSLIISLRSKSICISLLGTALKFSICNAVFLFFSAISASNSSAFLWGSVVLKYKVAELQKGFESSLCLPIICWRSIETSIAILFTLGFAKM